jgi:FkbM family methyltransferase
MSLITDWMQKYNVKPKGVIHVGAALGEEVDEWCALQPPPPVAWIEPNPVLIPELKRRVLTRPGHEVINVAAGEMDCVVDLHVCDVHFHCSSILPLGTHATQYPHIQYDRTIQVPMKTLDTLFADRLSAFDYLYSDTQGYELFILRGATQLLPSIKWCYLEYGDEELYRGSGLYKDLSEFLRGHGFVPKEKQDLGYRWGDCFFARA